MIFGHVEVFDVAKNRKKIAETNLSSKEIIEDRFDKELTEKTIKIVTKEFVNLVAEFMWTSAEDEEK